MQTHRLVCAQMQRAVPAVGSVTLSSRPDRGLWFETVQLAASLSYLPDGLAWPGVTLARSACLFSTFSLTHLLRLPPRTGIRTHFLPRGNVNTKNNYPYHRGVLGLSRLWLLIQNIHVTTTRHSHPVGIQPPADVGVV